jgi:hypothetical protein
LTNEPAPRRASVMLSAASRTRASRTTVRDMPKISARRASDGKRSPTARPSALIISTMPV